MDACTRISLREARKRAGYTMKTAAGFLEISESTLRKWEKYESSPTLRAVNRICTVYRCSLSSISWVKPKEYTPNQLLRASQALDLSVPELISLLSRQEARLFPFDRM